MMRLTEFQKQSAIKREMKQIVSRLAETDYITLKYVEGDYIESEWLESKIKRAALRKRYNELETELKAVQEQISSQRTAFFKKRMKK